MARKVVKREVSWDSNGWRTTALALEGEPQRREVLAICVLTDDPELITPLKLYKVTIIDDSVFVIDNEGEAAVYPAEFFMPLSLSNSEMTKLTAALASRL